MTGTARLPDIFFTAVEKREGEEIRRHAYRALFSASLDKSELHAIRTAATFGMPLDNDLFKEKIEKTLNRKLGYAQRGQPAKRVGVDCRAIEN